MSKASESRHVGASHYLFVILGEEPGLALLGSIPGETVVIGEEEFQNTGLGESICFYDWLRRPGGEIVGVRYYPLDFLRQPLDCLRSLRCVHSEPEGRYGEIFFSSITDVAEEESADQAFGFVRVYASERETYALCFESSWMMPSDAKDAASVLGSWISGA